MESQQPAWGRKIAKFFIIPQRVILSLMGMLAVVVAYTMRICLSLAIVIMVVKIHKEQKPSKGHSVCPSSESKKDEDKNLGGEYEWSEELQGIILSSFFFGYVVSHIPAGIAADVFGAKWPLFSGLFISSACSFLSPIAVRKLGAYALIGVRIFMGLGQGLLFPSLGTLIAQWVPKSERATLGALILGGGQIGTILGNSLSGVLLSEYDWDITFYFFGALGFVWCFIFALLCYSDPMSHPFIKDSEREYLQVEMGAMFAKKKDLPPVPWKAVFTNQAVIALIIGQLGHDWGLFVMVTDLPKYMGEIIQFRIKENGLYSSLPYFCMWVVSIISGFVSDCIIKNEYMTLTNSRKLMTGIAAFGPAIFMVLAAYAGCDKFMVVLWFTVAMGTMGTFYSGMKLTPIDLSPNYAGFLMAISNGLGALSGIIAPLTIGVMTPNGTLEEWRMVFWVAFVVQIAAFFNFLFWGSGDIQNFNDPIKMAQDAQNK